MKIFLGYDPREAVGFHTCLQSIISHGAEGLDISILTGDQRDATNKFGYERFRVPELVDYATPAIFIDCSDMLLRAPIQELMALRDPKKAIQVVKHDYRTNSPRKYIGTDLEAANEDYPRKNWSSVVIWNFADKAHWNARHKIREAIDRGDGKYLHRFEWLEDAQIGELPVTWNWLDEYGENPDAKLVHHTTGIPAFAHYRQAPHAGEWFEAHRKALAGLQ